MEPSGQKNLTQWAIIPQLWSLAWPMMLSMFFYTLYSIVDTFWVSKISTEAIAAVSISQIALFVMVALGMWVAVGSSVVMSMNIGAKKHQEASRVLAQSFVLATILAVFFTTIALVFRSQFLTAAGAIGAIYAPAFTYFTITSAGSVLFFYLINIMLAFNGEWDTFTLTKMFALSTCINVILDPIVIFGKFGFPALGVAGAAYATLFSQLIFVILGIYILGRPNRSVQFSWSQMSVRWGSVKQILKIGVPASLTQVINPIGLTLLTAIVSAWFFEAGATAFSLVFRLEFFAYLPAVSFGMASMAMIGQSMWAGKTQRTLDVFKKVMLLGFFSATGLGLVLMLFGRSIVEVFTTDMQVISYTLSYLFIVAGTYGLLAVSMISANIFQAIGTSWPGFWLFLTKFFIITVPIAYVSINIYDLPIWSVWIAIGLGNSIVAIIGYLWIRRVLIRKLT